MCVLCSVVLLNHVVYGRRAQINFLSFIGELKKKDKRPAFLAEVVYCKSKKSMVYFCLSFIVNFVILLYSVVCCFIFLSCLSSILSISIFSK